MVIPTVVSGGWILAGAGEADAAPPTGILLSSNTVVETSPANTVVGTLSAVDADAGGYHSFRLEPTPGSFNPLFSIVGNKLILSVAGSLDFETNPAQLPIRLSVTDNTGLTFVTTLYLQLLDDREEDADKDGLTQAQEEDIYGTSDTIHDFDGDGVGDGAEVVAGTSPTDPDSWSQTSILGWGRASDGEQTVPAGGEFFALATGQAHSLALAAGGAVVAWGGLDTYGQVSVPDGLGEVLQLAAGGDYWFEDTAHSLALRSDGTVVGWGYAHNGLLIPPAGLDHVVEVAAGRTHCIALKDNGTVVVWGENPHGALDPPIGLGDVIAVAAGGFRSLALKSNGTVIAWGSDYNGTSWVKSEVPAGLSDVVAISCGRFHSLALKSDGTVVAWGYNTHGQTIIPAGLSNVVSVAAGGFHSLALKNNGEVVAWGSNSHGQSTVPVSAKSGVKLISAGLYHSHAIRPGVDHPAVTSSPKIMTSPGGLVAHQVVVVNGGVPPPVFSAPGLPPGLAIDPATGLISGTAGSALRRSFRIHVKTGKGTLVQNAWLAVSEGNAPTSVFLTPPEVVENSGPGTVVGVLGAVDPDAGDSHEFELIDGPGAGDNGIFRIEGNELIVDQAVVRDFEATPADFSIRVRVRDASLNPFETIVALRFVDDRTEDADGDGLTESEEEDIHFTLDTKRDSDGDGFEDGFEVLRDTSPSSAAAFPGGRMLVGWGLGDDGRIDPPAVMSDVIDVSAGGDHSLALRNDGTIFAWGRDDDGQSSPPEVYQNVVAVEAGAVHSMVLKRDGTVGAWGNNEVGQTDVPEGLSGVVAISAGAYHNLALKSDGSVTAWGFDDYGQADVPAGLSDVVGIAAGGYHSMALKSDGTVVAWGSGWGGATVVPAGLNGVIGIAAGAWHCLALRFDGTVVAWGGNESGQTMVPEDLSGVTSVAAGWRHSLALKSDGRVVAWGNNTHGETEIPMEAVKLRRIDAGEFHNLAIRQDSGFPGLADGSPVRAWPGDSLARPTALVNATPTPLRSDPFSAMGLPAGLAMDSASGVVSGTVNTGERRAVRLSADTTEGVLDQVLWFDTADGVAPTSITLSANIVAENSAAGTVVGTLHVTDPDAGDSHTFVLVTDPDAPDSYWFAVSDGRLIVRFPLGVDYDSGKTQLKIRVVAVDSGNNRFTRDFVIDMTDDRSEDGDGDHVIQSMEEDVFGTSDSVFDDIATADADHDGVAGMLEYAFNLDPKTPGPPRRLVSGANSSAGLPAIEVMTDSQGRHRLRMEFLRRIGDELIYTPQFSSGLGSGDWESVAVPTVVPVDSEWERCVVVDEVAMEDAPRRFGRVGVLYGPADRSRDNDGDGIDRAMEEDVFGTSDFAANDFRTEDTDHDGVPSMIEYAFNLDPQVAGPRVYMVPGHGSVSGLPAVTLVGEGAGIFRLRIEFLRRVGGFLKYTPQFGSGPGDWVAAANPVTVIPIDAVWEICVVEDTLTTADAPRRFARVLVSW